MRNVSLPRRDFSPAGVSRWFYRSSENEWVCSFIQKVMETRTQRETMPGCISVKQVNMTFSAAYLLIKTTSTCYQETWHLAEFTQWWRDYRCFLVVSSSCFRQLQLDVVPPDPERCGWRAEGGWSFSPDDSSPPARRQLELRGPPGAADADGKWEEGETQIRRRAQHHCSALSGNLFTQVLHFKTEMQVSQDHVDAAEHLFYKYLFTLLFLSDKAKNKSWPQTCQTLIYTWLVLSCGGKSYISNIFPTLDVDVTLSWCQLNFHLQHASSSRVQNLQKESDGKQEALLIWCTDVLLDVASRLHPTLTQSDCWDAFSSHIYDNVL